MRVFSAVGQFTRAEVHDVVRAVEAKAAGRAIQPGLFPHEKSNGVIGARRVSAYPQPTDPCPFE